jgi:uncharacterized RDD family membrane protein YckC
MKNVSFLKRIVVIVYDGFLLVGVTLVGYGLLFMILRLLPSEFELSIIGKAIKLFYLMSVSFCFYAWFWTHGGQTLGMKVWNLFLVDRYGKFISWKASAIRYLSAILSWVLVAGGLYALGVERWYLAIGLGFTWSLFNRNNLCWHDMLSGTRIVQVPNTTKLKPAKD